MILLKILCARFDDFLGMRCSVLDSLLPFVCFTASWKDHAAWNKQKDHGHSIHNTPKLHEFAALIHFIYSILSKVMEISASMSDLVTLRHRHRVSHWL